MLIRGNYEKATLPLGASGGISRGCTSVRRFYLFLYLSISLPLLLRIHQTVHRIKHVLNGICIHVFRIKYASYFPPVDFYNFAFDLIARVRSAK